MFAPNRPKLMFKEEFDERLAFEVSQKGWCGIAMVELPEGGRVDVFFYSPERLARDLENGRQGWTSLHSRARAYRSPGGHVGIHAGGCGTVISARLL